MYSSPPTLGQEQGAGMHPHWGFSPQSSEGCGGGPPPSLALGQTTISVGGGACPHPHSRPLTKWGAGSGTPGESSQRQAGQDKIPSAEGSFHGNKWLHSLPSRSAQSHFLLLQNLLNQLAAEFGCGWVGMSVSMVDTHSNSLSIFKMQTA